MSLVTSIQRYSIHDGDGIRTTVFFKGCYLKCQWCHNPETQKYNKEVLCDVERCVGCGRCEAKCPEGAVKILDGKAVTDKSKCTTCGACADVCLLNLREVAGKEYTVNELLKEIKKDEMFYEESGGGVTLSGGEVMTMDMDFIVELMKKLKRLGITITIDTCGQAPYENYEKVLPYVNTFLYDVKTMDTEIHKKYMGTGNELILSNLERISKAGARIYIRIPTVKEVNGDDESMKAIIDYLLDKNISVAQVNLLPYHNTGSSKYTRCGREYEGKNLSAPTGEEMEHFAEMFKSAGFRNTKIGG